MIGTDYTDTKAWQLAMDLVQDLMAFARDPIEDPAAEALFSEICAVGYALPVDVAGGWNEEPTARFLEYVNVARNATYELSTLLEITERLGFGDATRRTDLLSQTDRLRDALNDLHGWLHKRVS